MLRGRYGFGWMVFAWLALGLIIAAAVWGGFWLAGMTSVDAPSN